MSDNLVNSIIEDYDGNLWIGAATGLNYFDINSRTFVRFRHDANDAHSLTEGFVVCLYLAGDSTLWVGTTNGLNRFHRATGDFTRYTTKNGLANNFIKGIIEDGHGMLWISNNKGISRFDPSLEVFKNYDASDGLQGNEFYRKSIYRTRNGEIFIGGVNGFNVFHPDSLVKNPYVPPIVITNFEIFNKPVAIGAPGSPLKKHISRTQELTLSYKQSIIAFEFTALNYIFPRKNQYAYMLDGFESDWNYVGDKRTAVYTNLDPGEYYFRVKGANNDGVWNEAGTAIKIVVRPPFGKHGGLICSTPFLPWRPFI